MRPTLVSLTLTLTTVVSLFAFASAGAAKGASPPGHLYVLESGAVLVFPLDAKGNVAPEYILDAPHASLGTYFGFGFAFGPNGRLFVAGAGTGTSGPRPSSILVFLPGSRGHAHPSRVIAGPPGPVEPAFWSVSVDAAGYAYAADVDVGQIDVFPSNSSGDVAPARVIAGSATGLVHPSFVALDAGGDLFVINGVYPGPLLEFAPGASGNATPIATLQGELNNISIVGQTLYAVVGYPLAVSVELYALPALKLVRTLQPRAGLAVNSATADASGNVYVAYRSMTNGNPRILVFGPSGPKPIRAISGNRTHFNAGITQIAVGP